MSTESLQRAVQRTYKVFGRHRAPAGPLNVCTGCCMPARLEAEMRQLPLAKLTALHFREYCEGAVGNLDQAAEVKYLLPRWLDLLAQGESLRLTIELALDRVGQCPRESFSTEELSALNEFMLAYFDCCLIGGFKGKPIASEADEPLSVLLMADYAGLDLQPLLSHWTRSDAMQGTLNFVRQAYLDFWPDLSINTAFSSDRPQFRTTIKEWLLNPATKSAFLDKLMAPGFLAQIDQVPSFGHTPFSLMVDAAFEHLSN